MKLLPARTHFFNINLHENTIGSLLIRCSERERKSAKSHIHLTQQPIKVFPQGHSVKAGKEFTLSPVDHVPAIGNQ